MGLMTRAALCLMFAAGVLLAACGLLPWYQFPGGYHISGLDAHAVSDLGDGYILLVLGTICATLAAWLILAGRLNALALVAIAVASSASFGISITSLTRPGNVCGPSYFSRTSNLVCISSNGGDVFGSIDGGMASAFLWLATGLGLFAFLMTIALPVIEDYLYEDYEASEEVKQAWA